LVLAFVFHPGLLEIMLGGCGRVFVDFPSGTALSIQKIKLVLSPGVD
jgi:hypothetical protein